MERVLSDTRGPDTGGGSRPIRPPQREQGFRGSRGDRMEMKKTSAFDPPEFQERLRRVRARMAEKDLAALLLTTPENICYVSGYQTPGYYYLQALIVSVD